MRVMLYLFAQLPALITSAAWLIVTDPLQLSEAVTPPLFGDGIAEAHATATFAGTLEITGAMLSLT